MPIHINPNATTELDKLHADWWDPGDPADNYKWREDVWIKPVKSYLMDTRARTRASRIPDGLTWDDLQTMTAAERSKYDLFDAGVYQLSLFKDCVVRWTLRFPDNKDGSKGAIIPCTEQYFELLPDIDGAFIAGEIVARAGGITAQVEAESKYDFPKPTDTVAEGTVSGPSTSASEEAPAVL
jgi:hypothetical protein